MKKEFLIKLLKNKLLNSFLLLFFCVLVFTLSIRGIPGNPTASDLNKPEWHSEGPFEQSGRFALLYSFVENHSFYFSLDLARFAAPDLATINGKYVSLFPPGISFIGIPGYLLGKTIGLAQVGTFATITLFAILNIFLLRSIARKLGINSTAATLGALTFAFATPAFAYGVDFFQHHVSTFLILLSIYSLLYFSDFLALVVIWLCFGISIPVDYPNVFMLMPVLVVAALRLFIKKPARGGFEIRLKTSYLLPFVAALLPVFFFLWFNQASYGNPFRLSGALPRVTQINEQGKPVGISAKTQVQAAEKSVNSQLGIITSFKTRLMLNGFYVHFISPDRGMIVYTPVMALGFIGLVSAYRRKMKYINLLAFIAAINILLYSMWGDPWGGWSFGSRYLIPAYAILSVFIAWYLSINAKRTVVLLSFFILVSYSVAINTLGALTSSLNPPSVESAILSKQAGYYFKDTYARNIDFLNNQGSKSYIYKAYLNTSVSAVDYYIDLSLFIILVFACLVIYSRTAVLKEENDRKN